MKLSDCKINSKNQSEKKNSEFIGKKINKREMNSNEMKMRIPKIKLVLWELE